MIEPGGSSVLLANAIESCTGKLLQLHLKTLE